MEQIRWKEETLLASWKRIDIYNYTLTVPVWVNYVAVDKDGTTMGYKLKPVPTPVWEDWTPTSADHMVMGKVDLFDNDWEETLIEV